MTPGASGLMTILGGRNALGPESEKHLRALGFSLLVERDSPAFEKLLETAVPRVVIIELSSDCLNRLELLKTAREKLRQFPCIVIVHEGSEELAVAALRAGANEYLKTPLQMEELNAALQRLAPPPSEPDADAMVGSHNSTRAVKRYLARAAATDSTVLITGETGTGKELAASYIHSHSHRRKKPFVSVNCAALPDTLLESELFGYERGAFTGANTVRDGKWKAANGGTLFLDEVGEMSPSAQAKILRVLDNGEVWRLGGLKGQQVNVRVVAATNQEIEKLVDERKFRADLYFRLNVARVHLPPLRERRSDIPLLLNHYVSQMNRKFRRNVVGFDSEAMNKLSRYDWPGNVRELKNVVEAAFVELAEDCFDLAQFPKWIRERLAAVRQMPVQEREQLLGMLAQTHWNVSKAASQLHLSRMTLYRKMAKYQIARTHS
jgi:DNA-binding NtrC family response regulator